MKKKYFVKLNYCYGVNLIHIQVNSAPFMVKADAHKYIEEQKILLSMINATEVEIKIECKEEIMLDYQTAKVFINNLKFKSKDEYFKWWDKHKPSFLPRNVDTFYKEESLNNESLGLKS